MKKILKDKKAITLIALVITIVVLVILAVVTISLTVGNDGLIARAIKAAKGYKDAQENEKQGINDLYGQLAIAADGTINGLTLNDLQAIIDSRVDSKLSKTTTDLQEEITEKINENVSTDMKFTFVTGTNYIAKKYDNGIMEIYGKYSGTMTTTTAWGSGYFDARKTITFPIAFTSTPYVVPVLSRDSSANVFSLSLDSVNSTSFNYYTFSMGPQVTNANYSLSYVAIGRWK